MKRIETSLLFVVGLLLQPALAADTANSQQTAAKAVYKNCCGNCYPRTFHAAGTVRKIDIRNGIVTIFHAPIDALLWPSMTMPFAIEDRQLIDRIKVGEKLRFEFTRDARIGVIVSIH